MSALVTIIEALIELIDKKRAGSKDRRIEESMLRRSVEHADIPVTYSMRQQHGERFENLVTMFIRTDPAGIRPKKSMNESTKTVSDSVRWQYEQLTRTVLHRLLKTNGSPEQVERILRKELELWFEKTHFPVLKDRGPDGLIAQVSSLKARWDFL